MKKIKLKLILTVLTSMVCINAFSYDALIDGIYYDIDGYNAIVVRNPSKYQGNVVIPSSVNYKSKDYSVTRISIAAFGDCSGLTSIEIPNSVTSIGDNAFRGCSGLTSIEIPNSVTSIGGSAFYGCTGLTSVTIPNSVTSIVGGTFDGCSGLTSVTIPNSVTSIGERFFGGCSGLTSIVIPNSVTSIGYEAFSGCSSLTSIEIPNSVTSIGERAFFYCSGLTSVTIPNSVTSIGQSAFCGCSGLTSIEIPTSVTSIGQSAFSVCTGLTSVTIPNSVTSIGQSVFEGCTGLTSVTIPNSVTSIGYSVFEGCTGLTSVTIPNSVTSIGSHAFSECTGLTSVTIGNSVTSIGHSVFVGCSGLTSVTINSNAIVSKDYSSGSSLKYYFGSQVRSYIIGTSVTSIGNYAFSGCSDLTSVTIPNSVTSIGDYAFSECSGLTSVTIPVLNFEEFCNNKIVALVHNATRKPITLVNNDGEEIIEFTIPNSVTSIGNYAFNGCSGLTSIEIPNSVTSIGDYAFYGCSNLTSVTIPNSVTSIGISSFNGCSGLTSIAISNSVTSIGSNAFSGCSGLTSIVIPNSVTSIGQRAFRGCSGLTSIAIPNNVTNIGGNAFEDCTGLKKVIVSDIAAWCRISFSNNTANPLYYAHHLYSDENTEITDLVIPDGETIIGNSSFSGCSGLTSVTIPNSVTSIGGSAFRGCKGLTSITIPNSVTSIGGSAFYGCSGLTSVTIPNSVTSIGEYAFGGCSELTTVTINADILYAHVVEVYYQNPTYIEHRVETNAKTYFGSQVKNYIINVPIIGKYAFYDCSGLTSITIGKNVTSIGGSAFGRCSGLTSVTIDSNDLLSGSKTLSTHFGEQVLSYIIGNSVTSIGGSGSAAFYGCPSLTSVTIGSGVTNISGNPFAGCRGNITIHVDEDNPKYDSRDNCNAIIEKETNTLVAGCMNTHIPNSVTSIGNNAFYNCFTLTSVTIPNSVTSIGDYAFSSCTGLTSIKISNNVTNIGGKAFKDCTGLKKVIVSNIAAWCRISFSNNTANPLYYAHHLYSDENTEITNLVIPDGETSIGNSAFYNCSGLTSIEIPNSVTSIGDAAFSGCTGLTSIKISNNVTSIGDAAFSGCTGLTSIKISNNVTNIGKEAFSGCSKLTSFTIPNGVTSIGNSAFYNCSGLTSIEIPNSVTNIGNSAFYGCSNLSSVKVYTKTPPAAGSDTFSKTYTYKTLYVPRGSTAAYQAADGWKDFRSVVEFKVEEPYEIGVREDVQAKGRQVSFSIDLKNETTDLTAYQFDMTLPDGFSLSKDEKGKFLVTKTNRYEDDSHTLTISKLEGNTYRFVCFSMSNEKISGTSGAILNVALAIGESVKEGKYEATISNVTVTKTDETQLKLFDEKFNIIVNFIKGDANGDGEVNVADIVEIVNYIMNKPSEKFIFSVADMNDDGEVNVSDIVKVVSLIMSSSSNAPRRASVVEIVDNEQLEMTCNDNQTLSLNLQNEGSYVASQFDIVLSAGQTLEGIQLNSRRMENHQLTYAKTDDNRYKVVIYSLNNAAYKGQSGELLNIKVAGSGDVSVEDILFVTAGQMEKRFPPLHRGTTGISVITNEAETMDIYTIDGRLIRKQAKSTDGLEKGLYIINGKKQIVR